MLVLGLRTGEKILIGGDITITLLDRNIHGDHIRIGVTAPRNVPVDRAAIRAAKLTGINSGAVKPAGQGS